MAEGKPIRLVVAAKQLNVGAATLVDTLTDGGFEIENKPTAKLSPEMYEFLMKEFRAEMNLKEEAEQITLGSKVRENVEIDRSQLAGGKKPDESTEIFVKSNTVETDEAEAPAAEKEKTEEEVIKADAAKLDGPTVVGKIDLEKKEPPKKEEKKEEAKEEPKERKSPVKIDDGPKSEVPEGEVIKAKTEKLEGPKVLGKIDIVEPKPTKKKEEPAKSDSKDDSAGKRRRRKRIIKPSRVSPEKEAARNRGGKKGDDDQPQVSEKEIEEKIKATMAKVAGADKGNVRAKLRRAKRQSHAEAEEQEKANVQENLLRVTEFISVSELASLMGISATEVISTCMNLGVIVSINQRLDAEIIELVADEFDFEIEFIQAADQEIEEVEEEDDPETLKPRAPIVTIMGHVDHGKTSLLDYIRQENVVDTEAGGITQHIGAYEVRMKDGKSITFLDTPGHEAFTAMRARGAKLTDIAVIVIAADDAVMPQTKEAISHAQSAGVPMIFAINKVDKDGSNPEKIKEQLSGMNILVEDWGGKFQSQELSAKTGQNVENLLEKILLEAELLELQANPDREGQGAIIEASLDKGRGYVATVLVQRGTLKIGDMMVAGSYFGKVKAMFDHTGKKSKQAGPSVPVQILGLNGAPQAGEVFKVYESEQDAKQYAAKRGQIDREQGIRAQKHITLDEIGRRLALGTFKELNVIIKGDVDGSIEALSDALLKLSTDEVQVNVLHRAVGQISESDVLLASASDAIIIGFQVRPSLKARQLAETENIEMRMYSVIYDAIEEIKSAMEGLLEPKIEEKIIANIEIRETFKITKVGTIAGCYVLDGKMNRNAKIRLIRDGIVIYAGELASLKRFKDDVKEVLNGQECGLNIKDFNDIKVGDIIEAYEEIEVQRTL